MGRVASGRVSIIKTYVKIKYATYPLWLPTNGEQPKEEEDSRKGSMVPLYWSVPVGHDIEQNTRTAETESSFILLLKWWAFPHVKMSSLKLYDANSRGESRRNEERCMWKYDKSTVNWPLSVTNTQVIQDTKGRVRWRHTGSAPVVLTQAPQLQHGKLQCWCVHDEYSNSIATAL